jgi:hypothetical protein
LARKGEIAQTAAQLKTDDVFTVLALLLIVFIVSAARARAIAAEFLAGRPRPLRFGVQLSQ